MQGALRAARSIIYRTGHLLVLGGSFALALLMPDAEAALGIALLATALFMVLLEWLMPARPDWKQTGKERAEMVSVFVGLAFVFLLVVEFYDASVAPMLAGLRDSLGLAIWPVGLPVALQVVMLYFASELIYYWLHRAIHASGLFWRVSGHGFHHSYRKLHSLHSGTNHPFEIVYLALPALLLGALFGADRDVIAMATVLISVNALVVHANVDLETPVLSFFVTNARHHRRHHSTVFEQSNTNFSCNAIIWDRLFGTF
ncbi:MAG: sterol desaturase family protein, partial [Gammaproteobacteria bacterium]|nr:sterol desaturase family protein [Gammaproteobacteria bacterium]